jgi:hypothetical protein
MIEDKAAEVEFTEIDIKDFLISEIPSHPKIETLSSFDFSIAATHLDLNHEKHKNEASPERNFIMHINVTPVKNDSGAQAYKCIIKMGQSPEISITKRFSEFYDFMEAMKNYYSDSETYEPEYCQGKQLPNNQNPRCYMGYHIIPNLYKPPALVKVYQTVPEGYMSEVEYVRAYFLRNFLLKVLTHSHLAECRLTKQFLSDKWPGETISKTASLVMKGKKLVGAMFETVVETKNKYFEKNKENKESMSIKQNLDWLCKFVRDYNQKLCWLYDNSVADREQSQNPGEVEVLQGLKQDMSVLQHMVEDTWVTLDSLLEAENILSEKKAEALSPSVDEVYEQNRKTWIYNTEQFIKQEKALVLNQVQKDCDFILEVMAEVYGKFTALETTSINK